ncbi:MAG: hypothetical protein K1X44_05630 [Alphaproteobacteria bacterium]|nr:hypothetical protein [Alphaproteobacteria bacterium]
MTQGIIRLAKAEDEVSIRRLQMLFSTEIDDPFGIMENSFEHSYFAVFEIENNCKKSIVGMVSLLRAYSKPFIFEQIFPDIWDRFNLQKLTGYFDITRDNLLEGDWAYLEKPYRGKALVGALWAALLVYAYHQGYKISFTVNNQKSINMINKIGPNLYKLIGLSSHVGNDHYNLMMFDLPTIQDKLYNFIKTLRREEPGIIWQLPMDCRE